MNDVGPRFRCTVCDRGVLNRAVPHCLYCGADLPAEARLAPEVIAQLDAEHAPKVAELAHLKLLPPVLPERSKVQDVIDGVAAGADLIGLIGDILS